MKCTNCSFEYESVFEYCPNCGTKTNQTNDNVVNEVEMVSINPTADKVMCALKDKLFLCLCILMTVSSGLSFIVGNIPIISVLITIFLWLTYSESKKGFVDHNHLKGISGTVYASYIITNVFLITCLVCIIFLGVVIAMVGGMDEINYAFQEAINVLDINLLDYGLTQEIMAVAGIILVVVLAICLIFTFIINVLGIRKIHRFIKSVYSGVMFQNPNFENVKAAKNWIIFLGVINAISAASSFFAVEVISALATASLSAATIIAGILIKKYLMPQESM